MNKKTKVIAMYLPQYHEIPENNEFWGEGFTDWITTQNANPLFKGHEEPRVPLGNTYYDLSKEEAIIWQSSLALKYGVEGFAVYHYWFNNEKNLLTKPAELIRDSDEVKINYFLAWDNASWVRSWSNVNGNSWAPMAEKKIDKQGRTVLIPYIIGSEKDWENHFNYLILHFQSPKYIKVNNKPVFIIFNFDSQVKSMCAYWETLAQENGFAGMHFIIKKDKKNNPIPSSYYQFKYEPLNSGWAFSFLFRMERKLRKIFKLHPRLHIYSYKKIWRQIINNARKETQQNMYHGAFVQYDDTPRRGKGGTLTLGENPDVFQKELATLIEINDKQSKDFIFLTAWNEWGEGAYLEPDTQWRYAFLEALQHATQQK